MPVKNICQLFPQKKESLVTLSRLSRIHSIYFFSAKCTSSRSVFYVNKKDTSTYYAQILPYQTKSIWKCLIFLFTAELLPSVYQHFFTFKRKTIVMNVFFFYSSFYKLCIIILFFYLL